MKIRKRHAKIALCLSLVFSASFMSSLSHAAGAQPVLLDRGLGEILSANLSGSYAVRIGDSKMAARAFEMAWLNDRSNYKSFNNAIKAHLIGGDLEKAVRLARMAQAPLRGPDANIIIANDDFKNNSYKSIIAFTDFDKLDAGTEAYARNLQAWALILSGKKDTAVEIISKKSASRAININSYYSRALMLEYLGDKNAAKTAYETAFNLGGRTFIGVTSYAQFLAKNGDKDKALDLIRSIDSNLDGILYNEVFDNLSSNKFSFGNKSAKNYAALALGNIAQSVASDNKAGSPLGEYAMALAQGKNIPILNIESARFLVALGLEDDAQKKLESLPPNSNYSDVGNNLNAALIHRNDANIGLALIEKNAKSRPTFANRTNLANFYIDAKKYDDALPLFDTLITQSNGMSEQAMGVKKWQLFYGRSNALIGLKNNAAAIKDLRDALELAPQNPILLNSLGYMLADTNTNLDEARKLIEKAVQINPQSGETIDSLGWILFRQGEYEEAIDKLEFAMMLSPGVSEIAEHLGDAYWITNRKEDARLEWSKAISLNSTEQDKARIAIKLAKGIDIPAAKAIVAQSN